MAVDGKVGEFVPIREEVNLGKRVQVGLAMKDMVEKVEHEGGLTDVSYPVWRQYLYNFKVYEKRFPDMFKMIFGFAVDWLRSNRSDLVKKFFDPEILQYAYLPEWLWNPAVWELRTENGLGHYVVVDERVSDYGTAFIRYSDDTPDDYIESVIRFIEGDLRTFLFKEFGEDIRVKRVKGVFFKGFYIWANWMLIRLFCIDPNVVRITINRVVFAQATAQTEADIIERIGSFLGKVSYGISLEDLRSMYQIDQIPYTGKGVVVGVVDTGVDDSHDFLAGTVLSGTNILSGRDDYNADDYGHGTHVAGIIKAIASDVKFRVVKVLDGSGLGNTSDIVLGLEYLYEFDDVVIVNMSLGACIPPVACNGDTQMCDLCEVVKDFNASGRICVVASGNCVQPPAGMCGIKEPCTMKVPYCPSRSKYGLSVGSVNYDLRRSYFSRYDFTKHQTPKLSAFGEYIRSTWLNNSYSVQSGTSMATPQITGFVALEWEKTGGNVYAVVDDLKRSYIDNTVDEERGFVYYPFALLGISKEERKEKVEKELEAEVGKARVRAMFVGALLPILAGLGTAAQLMMGRR